MLSADIKNCRIVLLRQGSDTPVRVWGKPYHCHHLAQPLRFASPNGVFPLSDGNFLVTEITHDWVSEINLFANPPRRSGTSIRRRSTTPRTPTRYGRACSSPSTTGTPASSRSSTRPGKVLWFYKPRNRRALQALTGRSAAERRRDRDRRLQRPGDRRRSQDGQGRLAVRPSRASPAPRPGYLDTPDGLDLAPPYSLSSRNTH